MKSIMQNIPISNVPFVFPPVLAIYVVLYFTGTVFLWLYWPSFNGGGVTGDEQHRAVINTYLSLTVCTLVTFVISALVDGKGKFDMVCIYIVINHSTLKGFLDWLMNT